MSDRVRVRFAPSPTGLLNLGGARSALFNWLFARHHNGLFLVRLEDTDRQRLVEGSEQQIKDSLHWLGLTPDEPPLVQSQRLAVYQKHAQQLEEKQILYPCWCRPERLEQLRRQAQLDKRAFKYDRYCLKHPGDNSEPHVLRFLVPAQPKTVSWNDAIKGAVLVQTDTIDDFVAIKSDGYPTYHFANVVDDREMEISDVLRADEWLASTPKHLLLYAAFGWSPPVFGHLPTVLGADGSKKLSKRHGAQDVLAYRDQGYLPEAVINFLALLGWNPGEGSTQEIFSSDELIKAFSINRVQSSPAVFDPARLEWLNGHYIRALSLDELLQRSQAFWPDEAKTASEDYRREVLGLIQDRLKFLAELPELTEFFFTDPKVSSTDLQKLTDQPKPAIEATIKGLEQIDEASFQSEQIEPELRQLLTTLNLKPTQLFQLIRLATTGKTAAPGLFETLAVLGRETTLRRLKNASAKLSV